MSPATTQTSLTRSPAVAGPAAKAKIPTAASRRQMRFKMFTL